MSPGCKVPADEHRRDCEVVQVLIVLLYLVDTPQWHTIDLERAGHQKQARVQLLQEHTSLALESAG